MSDADESSAEAFEQLRLEVALLRRAIEGAAATQEPIDYSPTLEALRTDVRVTGKLVQAMAQSPALRASLQSLNVQLDDVRNLAAARARQEWSQATDCLRANTHELKQIIGAAQTQDRQLRWLVGAGVAGIVVGVMSCLIGLRLAG